MQRGGSWDAHFDGSMSKIQGESHGEGYLRLITLTSILSFNFVDHYMSCTVEKADVVKTLQLSS